MECVSCGDCCLRMSPISAPEPCPHLQLFEENIYLCRIYKDRPIECQKHGFVHRFCPIGIEKLKLTSALQVSRRIDIVYEITKKGGDFMGKGKGKPKPKPKPC